MVSLRHVRSRYEHPILQLLSDHGFNYAGGPPDMVQIGNEITPGLSLAPGAKLGETF